MEISFIDLQLGNVLFLFFVGFIGGMVSGFIGSGGAFVLTPAMMSMGVPAIMAVASNMCHKFPKALVGSVKRAKYGQVDLKLGIIMGISAEAGVLVGAEVMQGIRESFGRDGSNLYVSLVFVVVLAVVGGYVLRDAWKLYRSGHSDKENVTKVALWLRSIRIPGTMMYFKSIDAEISVLFTIPLGFATGMLAATIAVGGFIGVPAMIYLLGVPALMSSATELVIAFVMGMGGTIKYAWSGFVDVRLAMIILAGSLFGIQLGAIGTTYVKDYMVKMVMGVIMILVLFSRALQIPVYLSNLGQIEPLAETTMTILDNASFIMLILALVAGGIIIASALVHGFITHAREQKVLATAPVAAAPLATSSTQLSPMGRFEKVLVVTDGSEFSEGAVREAIRLVQRSDGQLYALSVAVTNPEYEALAPKLLQKEEDEAIARLEQMKSRAGEAGVDCHIVLRHGLEVYQEIVDEAENNQIDVIVTGRRGKSGLMRLMMGSTTAKVIGHAHCSVMVVPRAAHIEGQRILLAVDGSRYSDMAASATISIARQLHAPVSVISVAHSEHKEQRHQEADQTVGRVTHFLSQEGIQVNGEVLTGRPGEAIVEAAHARGIDLIIIGSHGRTGLERMLMGSVSDKVIGHAQCAVLVVRA
ncbi:MAG: TSUP family transporter [Pseudomonadota bacterium]|nr:TSUP family transporter [Pseudomonadota bacterium]